MMSVEDIGGDILDGHNVCHPLVPPNSVYYVPDFLTATEERQLIEEVLRAPKPRWTYLSNRSLQVYGGYPDSKGMIAETLPGWLQPYTDRLSNAVFDGHSANQVLMNRYEPGQGIMAHEDGPLYYPAVATINTGSHTVLNLYRKSSDDLAKREYKFSLLLWPRSLSVLKRQAYTEYLHEIEELNIDQLSNRNIINLDRVSDLPTDKRINGGSLMRTTRYSFTVRYVPKCHKINVDRLFGKKL